MDKIQALIADIDGVLRKMNSRMAWWMSGDTRRVLERVRSYLVSLQQHVAVDENLPQRPDKHDLTSLSASKPAGDIHSQLVQNPESAQFEGNEQATAREVWNAIAQEMTAMRSTLMEPLQEELATLRQERQTIVQEIKQLEQARQHNYSLAQQQATQQQIISEFLQALMGRVQESLTQQVAQTLEHLETQLLTYESTSYPPNPSLKGSVWQQQLVGRLDPSAPTPILHPRERLEQMRRFAAESDQLLMSLDSTNRVVFEALQRNIQGYQESLSEGLEKMHRLGAQGELMFTALVNHLAQQLGREASSYWQASLHMTGREPTNDEAKKGSIPPENALTSDENEVRQPHALGGDAAANSQRKGEASHAPSGESLESLSPPSFPNAGGMGMAEEGLLFAPASESFTPKGAGLGGLYSAWSINPPQKPASTFPFAETGDFGSTQREVIAPPLGFPYAGSELQQRRAELIEQPPPPPDEPNMGAAAIEGEAADSTQEAFANLNREESSATEPQDTQTVLNKISEPLFADDEVEAIQPQVPAVATPRMTNDELVDTSTFDLLFGNALGVTDSAVSQASAEGDDENNFYASMFGSQEMDAPPEEVMTPSTELTGVSDESQTGNLNSEISVEEDLIGEIAEPQEEGGIDDWGWDDRGLEEESAPQEEIGVSSSLEEFLLTKDSASAALESEDGSFREDSVDGEMGIWEAEDETVLSDLLESNEFDARGDVDSPGLYSTTTGASRADKQAIAGTTDSLDRGTVSQLSIPNQSDFNRGLGWEEDVYIPAATEEDLLAEDDPTDMAPNVLISTTTLQQLSEDLSSLENVEGQKLQRQAIAPVGGTDRDLILAEWTVEEPGGETTPGGNMPYVQAPAHPTLEDWDELDSDVSEETIAIASYQPEAQPTPGGLDDDDIFADLMERPRVAAPSDSPEDWSTGISGSIDSQRWVATEQADPAMPTLDDIFADLMEANPLERAQSTPPKDSSGARSQRGARSDEPMTRVERTGEDLETSTLDDFFASFSSDRPSGRTQGTPPKDSSGARSQKGEGSNERMTRVEPPTENLDTSTLEDFFATFAESSTKQSTSGSDEDLFGLDGGRGNRAPTRGKS